MDRSATWAVASAFLIGLGACKGSQAHTVDSAMAEVDGGGQQAAADAAPGSAVDAAIAVAHGDASDTPSDAAVARPADAAALRATGGLVIPDAALEALAMVSMLSPEERMNREASCESGPIDGGIGLACTRRGGECPSGLTCTADYRGEGGICTVLGCGPAGAQCEPGASCCTLLEAGGVSLCFPDACLPATCLQRFQ